MSRLVIVVPCYNKERRLDVDAFGAWIAVAPDVDFLFVNDGSQDGTGHLLENMRSRLPDRVSVLTLEQNSGKAEAVRLGLMSAVQAEPIFVGFWDADLATPLDEVMRFLDIFRAKQDVEMVMGSRVKLLGRRIDRRRWRHYLGRVFATMVSMLLGLEVYDTQCGAKMFRSVGLIRDVISHPFQTRWLFDVEILARYIELHPDGLPGVRKCVYEVPVNSWRDVGASSLTPIAYVRAAFSLGRIVAAYGPSLRRTAGRA